MQMRLCVGGFLRKMWLFSESRRAFRARILTAARSGFCQTNCGRALYGGFLQSVLLLPSRFYVVLSLFGYKFEHLRCNLFALI